MPKVTEPRRRQARSVANDARILDAVVERLDSGGWEETSLVQIARQAGLTHPAVLDRYDSRTVAVVDTWRQRLSPGFRAALCESVDILKSDLRPEALMQALDPFVHPAPPMRAAIEVLLVARYVPSLAEEVQSTVGADLGEWLTPKRGMLTRAQAARRAFVVSLALGCVVESRRRLPELPLDLAPQAEQFSRALSARTFPVRLPSARALHLAEPPVFDTTDPALVALLTATLAEIGERGYEAATVKRIAEAAGYTTGLIFHRYESKRDLFLDATSRMLVGASIANHQFQRSIAADTSPGIADATLTREFMRPELKQLRTITYEQYRLSWHDGEMQRQFAAAQEQVTIDTHDSSPGLSLDQARAQAFLALARGAGHGLLADLVAHTWELPYDVVTVPLIDG